MAAFSHPFSLLLLASGLFEEQFAAHGHFWKYIAAGYTAFSLRSTHVHSIFSFLLLGSRNGGPILLDAVYMCLPTLCDDFSQSCIAMQSCIAIGRKAVAQPGTGVVKASDHSDIHLVNLQVAVLLLSSTPTLCTCISELASKNTGVRSTNPQGEFVLAVV